MKKPPENMRIEPGDGSGFITISGHTSRQIEVGVDSYNKGVVTIRNCGPAKIYINVDYEKI